VGVAWKRLGWSFADRGYLGEQSVAIDGRRNNPHKANGARLPSKQLQ
jgi:hypothetical protein